MKCQRDSELEKELPTEKEQTHPISGSETILFARVPLKERDHIDRNDVGLWIAWQTDGDKSSPSPRPRSTEKKKNNRERTCTYVRTYVQWACTCPLPAIHRERPATTDTQRDASLARGISLRLLLQRPSLLFDGKKLFLDRLEKVYLSLPLSTTTSLYFVVVTLGIFVSALYSCSCFSCCGEDL